MCRWVESERMLYVDKQVHDGAIEIIELIPYVCSILPVISCVTDGRILYYLRLLVQWNHSH